MIGTIRPLTVVVGLVTLCVASPFARQAQVSFPTPFEGRWKLTGVEGAKDFAAELLVMEVPGRSSLNIERRTADGARLARVPLNTSRPRTGETPATLSGGRMSIAAPVASTARVAPATRYEERWSIQPGHLLVIEVSSQSFAAVSKLTRATYQFVPLPRGVPASQNLVENGDASQGQAHWRWSQSARVDPCSGNPCFAIRGPAMLQQAIRLPADSGGKYALIIGSATSERVHDKTGLPYLYALLGTASGDRYVGHLQGMLGTPAYAHQWVKIHGIFPLPPEATMMFLDLKQAEVKGVPPNGASAWFDDVAVHIFDTDEEARTFARAWKGRGL